MATIDYSITNSSITLQLKLPEPFGYSIVVNWYIALDKSSYPSEHVYDDKAEGIVMSPEATESTPAVLDNLSYGNNIKFLCVVKKYSNFETILSIQGEARNNHVPLWSWDKKNNDSAYGATDEDTKDAFNAVSENGEISNFSYLVWNDMVYKVYDIIEAIGGLWQTLYALTNDTAMKSSDKVLTAVRFNSLIYNIEFHCGGININIPSVSQGDKVYGRYFLRIAECINDWIGLISIS